MILSIWLTHLLLLDGHHGEGLGRGQKGKEDSELHGDYYFGVGKVADGFFLSCVFTLKINRLLPSSRVNTIE